MRKSETDLPEWLGDPGSGGNGDDGKDDGNESGDGGNGDGSNSNDEYQDKSQKPPCPHCGKTDKVIPIIYGMPAEELFRKQQAGKVRLGGCVISGDGKDPEWYCKRDGEEF